MNVVTPPARPSSIRSWPRRSTAAKAKPWAIGWLAAFALGAAQADSCGIERVGSTDLVVQGGHFVVPALINGKSPVPFLPDTGAQRSAIDADVAAQLELPKLGEQPRRMTGTDGVPGRAYFDVTADRFAFADMTQRAVRMAVSELSGGRPNGIRGIIGAELLSRYDVEFDFPGKRLNLYRVSDCSKGSRALLLPWLQPYDTVPLKVSDMHILSLPVTLDGKTLELALDTGATSTKIAMDAAARVGIDVERLKAEAPRSSSYSSTGATMSNYSMRFENVQVGPVRHGTARIKISEIDVRPYDGLLGLDFLRARKVWVSYATQQLLLERTPARRSD
ncbi:retropepsin-like aspartic protease [Variovorax sp. J22R133]|uniref:retropepsin-like aspartic protease n=1 Tax=Variovorax brevis TaxID=3053503 RepID=UPI0025766C6B|nr:retropepsin-like aspartic protease [Variovorax sp. J22R133]MDM0114952.1 retropepsin-like aspartic protease [Variovorax sp. J22R133]